MENEKSCENCRYYLAHYVKTSEGYIKTTCGHCTKNWRYPFKAKLCANWDKIENAIPENERILDNRLFYLEKHIEQIQSVIELLKDLYGNQQ